MALPQRLQEIRDGFDRPFWVANISEIFERLSYYGAFSSLAAYYFLIRSIVAAWLAPLRIAVSLGLFVGCILTLPALGISLVKPSVVGTTARASRENVRSTGSSIYSTMVNIGGASGPFVAD